MSNKRNRRSQTPKPGRHSPDARVAHVQELRKGSRTSPHKVYTGPRAVRKYGIRAILNSQD